MTRGTTEIKILFLGAGKRLSLLEAFLTAASFEKIDASLWAIEKSVAVPIANVAQVAIGPVFESPEFESYLLGLVREQGINIVVPNMDSATVALAKCRKPLAELGCHALVSDECLCVTMEDKLLAEAWFLQHSLPTSHGAGYPRIVKRRRGFGSRGQFIAEGQEDLAWFFSKHRKEDYLDQPLVTGQEYTVDAYVDRGGRLLGALSRKRLAVSDGEVDVSEVQRHRPILDLTVRAIAIRGWKGPITLQFIDGPAGPVIIEINPRFGGGVTHSIHSGLDMPRWAIREHLGRPAEPFDAWRDGSIMTRCRRDIFL